MAAPSTASSSGRWLFGPAIDLLLGCGGAYVLLFLVFCVTGPELRLRQPPALAPLLILLFGGPHYAATLLRVYERRSERRRYAFFAVHATVAMVALFVLGLYVPLVGIALVTLYITWSPWHYSGQNFGLSMMFLGRRRVSVDGTARRALHGSFVLSWLLAILAMHAGSSVDNTASYAPTAGSGSQAVVYFQPLGVPEVVVGVVMPVLALLYVGALCVAAVRLRRAADSWADLGPAGLLVLTQGLWFSVPFVCFHFGAWLGLDPLDPARRTHYFLWIAVGHAVQYLWVSTYYARRAPGWRGAPAYLGKTVVAGTALWTLPLIAFAPWALGSLSYEGGLYLVLAAAINLHHFILDGAIWKLRDRKVGGALVRGVTDAEVEASGPRGDRIRRGVWVVAGLGCLLALVFQGAQAFYSSRLAVGDPVGAARSLDVLHWFGSDGARLRLFLARRMADQGELDAALGQVERALAMDPSPRAWTEAARLHAKQGAHDEAALAWEHASELAPARADLQHAAGQAWRRHGDAEAARAAFERALAVQPDHPASRRALANLDPSLGETAGR